VYKLHYLSLVDSLVITNILRLEQTVSRQIFICFVIIKTSIVR